MRFIFGYNWSIVVNCKRDHGETPSPKTPQSPCVAVEPGERGVQRCLHVVGLPCVLPGSPVHVDLFGDRVPSHAVLVALVPNVSFSRVGHILLRTSPNFSELLPLYLQITFADRSSVRCIIQTSRSIREPEPESLQVDTGERARLGGARIRRRSSYLCSAPISAAGCRTKKQPLP